MEEPVDGIQHKMESTWKKKKKTNKMMRWFLSRIVLLLLVPVLCVCLVVGPRPAALGCG